MRVIVTGGVDEPRTARRRPAVGVAITDAGAVVGAALRLLVRHWPVLFALFFAGYAAREFILVGAVRASKVNGMLGVLVAVLAPIAVLTALILMLRTVQASLPRLAARAAGAADSATAVAAPDGDPGTGGASGADSRPRNLLDHLGSALVPFLVVYASMDYLREDVAEYQFAVIVDDSFNRPEVFAGAPSQLAERLPATLSVAVVSVVVVAVVLRWLLSTWQGGRRRPWLGLFGAYVEVVWLVVVAGVVNLTQELVVEWVQQRQAVVWLTGAWNSFVELLGPLTEPMRRLGGWLVGLMASADSVIVVPIAWLAVGAVVYGRQLPPPPSTASELYRRAARWWAAVPRPIRFLGGRIGADLRDRFGPLVRGLRLLAHAGLAPMLLFCVAFIVSQGVEDWLWELERLLIGPRDLLAVWMPLSGPLGALNEAVGMVLLACLLAAAVDRVLGSTPVATPEPLSGPDGAR